MLIRRIFTILIPVILCTCEPENEVQYPSNSSTAVINIIDVVHTTPFYPLIETDQLSINKPEHHFMIFYKLIPGSQFKRIDVEKNDTVYLVKLLANTSDEPLTEAYESPLLSINYIIEPLQQFEFKEYTIKFWQEETQSTIDFIIER